MLICFTSDLHGRARLYDQLDALVRKERPDVLILGGDLFVDGDLDDPLGTQVGYIDAQFLPRVRRWRAEIPRLDILCILGNHDWLCADDAMSRAAAAQPGLILLDARKPWARDGVAFLGYSSTPPTPYWVKDFERRDRADDPPPETGGAIWRPERRAVEQAHPAAYFSARPTIADELAAATIPPAPWVFVCHAPPYDTALDRLPQVAQPIGSRAVREFIERQRPAVALHGHIHESPEVTGRYADTIGETLCINPGQHHDRLDAVLLDPLRPRETLRHTALG